MKEIKQNLLKTLLSKCGEEKLSDSLTSIMKTYDILEEEIVKGLKD